jgi:hypothetical protein
MFANGLRRPKHPLAAFFEKGDGVTKAALPLVLTALLGLGSGGVVAQNAPGDPAGNQQFQRRVCLAPPREEAHRMETRPRMETKISAIN